MGEYDPFNKRVKQVKRVEHRNPNRTHLMNRLYDSTR